jgi:hypothetical protein
LELQKSFAKTYIFGGKAELSSYEREEPHESSSLDSGGEVALVLCARVRSLSSHDAALRIDELLKDIDILVVDVIDVMLCEE